MADEDLITNGEGNTVNDKEDDLEKEDLEFQQIERAEFEPDSVNDTAEDGHNKGEQIEGEHVDEGDVVGEGEVVDEGKVVGEGEVLGEDEVVGEGEILADGETVADVENVADDEAGEGEIAGDSEDVGEGEVVGEGEAVEVVAGEAEGGKKQEEPRNEFVEDEEVYVEEPPPDPSAPYNFTDSQELLKQPFELRPDQLAEVEQLWQLYQDYTPAYTDLDGYITEKELIYMLKSLILMTYTPEQLQELIAFCVRPPHPQGHITFEQFLKIVTLRQRDIDIESELRAGLQVLDPEKTGTIDREYFREVLSKMGHKLIPKLLESLVKEVDLSNDGTIGIEDVVGTLCIDLNREDIIMLRQAIYPDEEGPAKKQDEEDY